MNTTIRRASAQDINAVAAIIEGATDYLKQQGLPQWQDGYGPTRADIEEDIRREEGYVDLLDGGICGYAAMTGSRDDWYETLTGGSWDETHPEYGAIHRVAFDPSIRGKGLAKPFLRDLIAEAGKLGYRDLRIDTHPGNLIMQKVIVGAGFICRGLITLPIPDGKRRAYQLLLC